MPVGCHTNDQLSVPDAVLQVAPPSVETSTLLTPEPAPSDAVPAIVIEAPLRVAPFDGSVMLVDGLVMSTSTLIPGPGVSVLPVLSTALDFKVYAPSDVGVHEYDQFMVPEAVFQVAPSSVDTSTLWRVAPWSALAPPEIVQTLPGRYEPLAGAYMAEPRPWITELP
jgi:hypothetical protein